MIRLALFLLALMASHAEAAGPRIISINLCTDHLLLSLADADQVLGLSPYAARTQNGEDHTPFPGTLPVLSGTAEEVLNLKPDRVVAGRFTKRTTRELIRAKGIPVEEFEVARTVAEARAQIIRMGAILKKPERAAVIAADLDQAVARARAVALANPLTVLPLQRRGWVSGEESLITDLLGLIGLKNAASRLGLRAGGFVGLETVVKLKPDLLILAQDEVRGIDQGEAMLLHPALQESYPASKRLSLSGRMSLCGGPGLVAAINHLAELIEKKR